MSAPDTINHLIFEIARFSFIQMMDHAETIPQRCSHTLPWG